VVLSFQFASVSSGTCEKKGVPVATNLVHVAHLSCPLKTLEKELAQWQLCSQSRLAHPLMSELSLQSLSQKTLERAPASRPVGFHPHDSFEDVHLK